MAEGRRSSSSYCYFSIGQKKIKIFANSDFMIVESYDGDAAYLWLEVGYIGWLVKVLREAAVWKADSMFYKSFHFRDSVVWVEIQKNNKGGFMVISQIRGKGRRSFIVELKGEGSWGWNVG